jgi:hypothetical protein
MTSKQITSVPAILRQRVIVDDGLVFDAEREVTLPIQPFVGMVLYNVHWSAVEPDEGEEPIKEVACDLKTGEVFCYLENRDFRPESSGCHWTESEVRERYQDWKLTRDEMCRPSPNHERNGH